MRRQRLGAMGRRVLAARARPRVLSWPVGEQAGAARAADARSASDRPGGAGSSPRAAPAGDGPRDAAAGDEPRAP